MFSDCATSLPGKTVTAEEVSEGLVSAVVYGGESLIPDGMLLECAFAIVEDAPAGESALIFVKAEMADDRFHLIVGTGSDGSVTVLEPTATPSATPTDSEVPTETATATATEIPSATASPAATEPPTPTATPIPCPGDCGGDRIVTVDELLRAVNIALGSVAAETCPASDPDASGTVTVAELVQAVGFALQGCPSLRKVGRLADWQMTDCGGRSPATSGSGFDDGGLVDLAPPGAHRVTLVESGLLCEEVYSCAV
jgi:hypothetical protein